MHSCSNVAYNPASKRATATYPVFIGPLSTSNKRHDKSTQCTSTSEMNKTCTKDGSEAGKEEEDNAITIQMTLALNDITGKGKKSSMTCIVMHIIRISTTQVHQYRLQYEKKKKKRKKKRKKRLLWGAFFHFLSKSTNLC